MPRSYIVAVILVIGVLGATACDDGVYLGGVVTCDDLAPKIIDLSEENANQFAPKILKISEISEEEVIGEATLQCSGLARLSRGEPRPIDFYILEDADGDRFIGYEAQ